jgi:hypothetical protein
VKINVGCGQYPARAGSTWTSRTRCGPASGTPVNGLPDVDEPIERIYAGHVLEHIEKDLVTPMLESWLEHPQVTSNTLIAIVGPDCDLAKDWVKDGRMTQQAYEEMESGGGGEWPGDSHLWRSTSKETYPLVRDSGWGISPLQPRPPVSWTDGLSPA